MKNTHEEPDVFYRVITVLHWDNRDLHQISRVNS